jgi:hypothetical protein
LLTLKDGFRILVTLDSFPLERFGFPATDITLQNSTEEIKVKVIRITPLLDTLFLVVFFLDLFLDPEDEMYMFFLNVGRLSTVYTALYYKH